MRHIRVLWVGFALLGFTQCSDGGGGSSSGGGGAVPGWDAAPPEQWRSADVGAVGAAGKAEVSGPLYELRGSGADIWDGADAFRFLYQALCGDGEITARVLGLDPTDEWAKSGVMIRESLDPSSPFAMTVVTPSHGTSLQWRERPGEGCGLAFGPGGAAPTWVRLTRTGDLFAGAASPDGRNWTAIGSRTIPLGPNVLIGLCVTAHNNTLLASTRIDSVGLRGEVAGWGASAGLRPVPPARVSLSDPFWAPRIETNRTASLPMMYQAAIDNHTLENFPKAAGLLGGNHDGFMWADGDIYGLLEGMATAIQHHPDAWLEARLEETIANILAAQVKSGPMAGYLNTYFQLGNAGRGGGGTTLSTPPWEDLIAAHEHMVAGNFILAALAHFEATGRTYFLDAARRYSDHMSTVFGEGRRSGVPGHQGLEHALFRLWAQPGVGRPSDAEQSKFYLDERGRHSGGRRIYGEYCQDLRPIRAESEPLGHCVRGPYQYAAATDLAAATGDAALLEAVERVWTNVVERKMYVTGGIGHWLYNEGFGPDYDLAPEEAYNETCAACGMIFWTHRLANLRADARYTDVLERILYNGFPSGRSIDGTRLYYNNDMVRHGLRGRMGIACCATNTVRTVPSVPGYQYATREGEGIWTHLYMAGQAAVACGDRRVGLRQETNYPWDGNVRITVTPSEPAEFTLHLRIPGWAAGATATVNGAAADLGTVSKGYLPLRRTWQPGDVVQLTLPMAIRRVASHPQVFAHRGRVAIVRGPIVYALESPDNPISVHRIVIPPDAALSADYDPGFLGGVVRIRGTGRNADDGSPVSFTMIPYGVWDNRNHDSALAVMVPETAADAVVRVDRGRAGEATVTRSHGDGAGAVNDGILPRHSADMTVPRFTWWDRQGTEEWIACEFPQPVTIARSDLFWFRDVEQGGGCDFPQTFRHEYWTGSGWAPLVLDADYMNMVDLYATWHFTIVRFAPVTTTKVRLVAQLRPGRSAGLLEWRLPESSP